MLDRLPRELDDIPGLQVLYRHLDYILPYILVIPEVATQLDCVITEGLFQLK